MALPLMSSITGWLVLKLLSSIAFIGYWMFYYHIYGGFMNICILWFTILEMLIVFWPAYRTSSTVSRQLTASPKLYEMVDAYDQRLEASDIALENSLENANALSANAKTEAAASGQVVKRPNAGTGGSSGGSSAPAVQSVDDSTDDSLL
jgi:hypothetical protein